jgi:hypothetical protein
MKRDRRGGFFCQTRRHLWIRQSSRPGQAMDHALGQWDLLGRYLHDGRLEIDNNQVEPERSGHSLPTAARRVSAARQNAIRPTALGKKNWSSSATPNAANVAPSSSPSFEPAATGASIPSTT